MDTRVPLRVKRIDDVALDVKAFEFAHVDGLPLAPFTAGSHIELQLPNHVVRSYSLLNAPSEVHRYQIAVHRTPDSAGGSRYLHEELKVGEVVLASTPRNNFPLHESAPYSCFIAGGIGVTPLLPMAHRLVAIGRPWEIHLCAKTRRHAAFVEEILTLAQSSGGTCHLHFDHEPGGQMLDIGALIQRLPQHTHFYCCGPNGMLGAFEQATVHCSERRHVEYFAAKNEAALTGGYVVRLARSGRDLQVPPGRSILDIVLEAGVAVATSCREGICGSCETKILEGEADHRDALLTPEEQAANQSMMICCSGAKSARLVLDL